MSNDPTVQSEPACCSDRPCCCEGKATCCTTPPDPDGTSNPNACACRGSCQR